MNTFEFEITIQSKSGAHSWPIVLRCKQPDGLTIHCRGTLQLGQDDFDKLTQAQENEKEYGTILGKALFREDVREKFVRALSKSSQDCPLRILLSIEAANNDEVRTWHWERLCAPIDGDSDWQLLARDQRVPFSQYIPTPVDRRFPPMGRRDLRALVLVASPSNLGKYQLAPFDVNAVLSGVKPALGDIPYEVLANDLESALGPPTLAELSKQLTNAKKPYTLLHFVCHGKLIEQSETVLFWAQADNQALPVTGTELLGELSNIGGQRGLPHFAFLCTCSSADPRAEGALGGLAQRLVRELGMPAVVAMTRKVSTETALTLGQNFYRRLKDSGEVDLALQEATAGLGNRPDITVPALFSRLGGCPLFSDRLDERQLSDEEIEYGIGKLKELLKERAPDASELWKRFQTQEQKLKDTQGADAGIAREQRHLALVELNNLCEQVIDLSFDALAALGKEPPEYKAECPFPGLSSFGDKKYHKFFFGRDELIKELQSELEKDNFLAVLGPSGSGKSSVVLAGLIPQLKEQESNLQWMRPGREPVKQLERRLERLSKVLEADSVLVVDQFEELFTLCEDKAKRQEFITKLLTLAASRKVVMTMRADFLGECTFYPELSKRIETRQKLIGPMKPAELITAMKMQADKAGLRFEAGLSNSILNDVQQEPGAMPLLQYALRELWKRRHGRWLCNEEYEAIGRVQQAIAKTADDFYNSLSPGEQELVRNIFLRLTRTDASAVHGEKRRDTRRRVELEELVSADADLALTKKLVQQLAGEGARLVVTSRNEATEKEEVEVAHEALIRYWPRLQKWLDQSRRELQLRETITQAAQEWKNYLDKPDKSTYLIHQGGRLEDASALLKKPKFVHLNQLEAEYVKACLELRDRQETEKEQQRQRELDHEKKARKAAQTLNSIVSISAAVLAGLAIFAGFQWKEAEIGQIKVLGETSKAFLVSHDELKAVIEAIQTGNQFKHSFWRDPELGNQVLRTLKYVLYRVKERNRLQVDRPVSAVAFSPDDKMIATLTLGYGVQLWKSDGTLLNMPWLKVLKGVSAVAFSPKGKIIATAIGDKVVLWNLEDGTLYKILGGSGGKVMAVAFSADGKMLATANTEIKGNQKVGTVQLWNLDNSTLLKTLQGDMNDVQSTVAFSPDGQKIAAGGWYGATLWKSDGTWHKKLDGYYPPPVNALTFSPDGKMIATGGNDQTVRLWQTSDGRFHRTLPGHGNAVWGVSFSPNSQIIASASSDNTVKLWQTSDGRLMKTFEGHSGGVHSVAFNHGGKTIASASDDGTVKLWKQGGSALKSLSHDAQAYAVAFSPNGKTIATTSGYGWVTLWNSDATWQRYERWAFGPITTIAFSPNGQLIATASQDRQVILRNIVTNNQNKLEGHNFETNQTEVFGVSFSPNGQTIATAGADGTVQLFNSSNGKLLKTLDRQMSQVRDVSFSPNGQMIASASEDGTVKLWKSNGTFLKTWRGHEAPVSGVAFSPDGNTIASASEDRTVKLWKSDGTFLKTLSGHKGRVLRVAFSPDGNTIASASADTTVKLWKSDGTFLQTLLYHEGRVLRVAFSPDGNTIASASSDKTVILWNWKEDLNLERLLVYECDWVRDYLKHNQTVAQSDRHLCDDIGTASNLPNQ